MDYAQVAEQVFLALDAGRAMRDLGLPVPASAMRTETIMGRAFDPANPAAWTERAIRDADSMGRHGSLLAGGAAVAADPGRASSAAWESPCCRAAGGGAALDPEYAALLGQAAAQGGQTPMPGPSAIGARLWELLRDPFYVRGTNDQGIGVQIAYSLLRVGAGFGLAALVAIPLGFLIGMSPLLNARAEPLHPGAAAGLAAGLDAARALHHQGQRDLRDLRDLHLLGLADAAEHRLRRRPACGANG